MLGHSTLLARSASTSYSLASRRLLSQHHSKCTPLGFNSVSLARYLRTPLHAVKKTAASDSSPVVSSTRGRRANKLTPDTEEPAKQKPSRKRSNPSNASSNDATEGKPVNISSDVSPVPKSAAADRKAGGVKKVKKVIKLSPEQQEALNLVKQGHNVFITGCAGTGGPRKSMKHAALSCMPTACGWVVQDIVTWEELGRLTHGTHGIMETTCHGI